MSSKDTSKPMQPSYSGRQFADDSMTPGRITYSYDAYNNEMAQDRPMHQDTTPGVGSTNWSGGQYSDDWNGGFSNYGVEVTPPSASNSSVTVDNSRADRGKES